MKRLWLLILLLALPVQAIDLITLTITVTNHAETGDELTINGATRIFTNANSSSTILTNSATGPAPTATNVAFNLSAYLLADNPWVVQTNTNTIRLVFPLGVTVSASESGNWATFLLSTQTVSIQSWTIRVPRSIESATNQTNFGSMLLDYFSVATNRFQPAWEAMTNFAAIARNNNFTGTNVLQNGSWTNARLVNMASASGILGALTNGVLTNTILQSPSFTNAQNFGNAFRSPGLGTSSEQFGSGAQAKTNYAIAIGSAAEAQSINSSALGAGARAVYDGAMAIGASADVVGTNAIGIGSSIVIAADNGIAIGTASVIGNNHSNSIALGVGVDTTETNQIMIGKSFHKTRIPGRIEPTGTITNAVFTGTNSFGISGGPYGGILFRRYNNAALANGNNAGVNPGDATFMKVSGPSAAFAVCGVTNGSDGRYLIIENYTGFNMTIANDSGVDPTPANRIYTLAGGDLTFDGSSVITLIYDSALSRWLVIGSNPGDLLASYGELYTDGNVAGLALATAGTYYVCTNVNTAGNSSVVTVDAATSKMTINGGGVYECSFHSSFGGSPSKTYTYALFTNGVIAANMKAKRKLDVGGDIGGISVVGIVKLPSGAEIDMRVSADDNSVSVTNQHANFRIHKIE